MKNGEKIMLNKNTSYRQNIEKFENLALSFLIARRLEIFRRENAQTIRHTPVKKYMYQAKGIKPVIYLTLRQHQCLQSYYRHKNMKLVAKKLGISDRTAEEHFSVVRKKFQLKKINELLDRIDKHWIEYLKNTEQSGEIINTAVSS